MARALYSFVFITLAVAVVGCSFKGASSDVLTSAGAARSAPGLSPNALHPRIVEFDDLPKYGTFSGYYYPSGIAAGADGLLWILDGIDQDSGAEAIVGVDISRQVRLLLRDLYGVTLSASVKGLARASCVPSGLRWKRFSMSARIETVSYCV